MSLILSLVHSAANIIKHLGAKIWMRIGVEIVSGDSECAAENHSVRVTPFTFQNRRRASRQRALPTLAAVAVIYHGFCFAVWARSHFG